MSKPTSFQWSPKQLIKAMEELNLLMNNEIEAVKKRQFENLEKLFMRKQYLVNYISIQKQMLANDQTMFSTLDEASKLALKDLAQKLQDTSLLNARELEMQVLYKEELMKTIHSQVIEQEVQATSYNKDGSRSNRAKKSAQALSIDAKL